MVTRELVAYVITASPPFVSLEPAAAGRAWMDASSERFAYRCLPMLMANQAGWFLVLNEPVEVLWDGTERLGSVSVKGSDVVKENVTSHFGHGIVTFRLPYLFRTAPGYNLLARGPANWPKDGLSPLEGLIETDWSVAPFTMNWQITRPRERLRFEAGEPIGMLVPQARGELESFAPRLVELSADAALHRRYDRWFQSRRGFLRDLHEQEPEAVEQGWQKDYFQGRSDEGASVPEHQTKILIRPFTRSGRGR